MMPVAVDLDEWQTLHPDECPTLRGRFLDDSPATRHLLSDLEDSRLLGVEELRRGTRLRAFSHVGRVDVGGIRITIRPKLGGPSLLRLLRYAYGFRKLRLLAATEQGIDKIGFEDLLVAQLNAEVEEILSRGVHRAYTPRHEQLESPRGRIDVHGVVRKGGRIGTSLPCRYHPRREDAPLNRVVMAGLRLAAATTTDPLLARESRRNAAVLEEGVKPIRLDFAVLDRVERAINRLTAAYQPAIAIIRLLVEANGVTTDEAGTVQRLPGFLFDMNRFFQALVGRFLADNLPAAEIIEEYKLRRMMRYAPGFNPQKKHAPAPRPDFVIAEKGRPVAILDAKYRDLWETSLPREMLYQLVVYAISHRDNPRSAIIYPTANPAAREARIYVADSVAGRPVGQVSLRPLPLAVLDGLVNDPTRAARTQRIELARFLAFGSAS